MSTATLYSTTNMSSQYGSLAASDRGGLLNGLRTSPRTASVAQLQLHQQQQQQQQIQLAQMQAMYQQQQYELAQQQAALELQLQLEQFRLQNLALQEQIMLGQVAQAQAHAEAEAALQQRLGERNVYTAPQKSAALGSRGFAAAQGGVLAERALARRTQQHVQAQDQQQTPVHQQVYSAAGHHRRQSSTESYLSSSTSPHDPNAPTPALVLSKPGEAFPVSSPSPPAVPGGVSHKHSDSDGSSSSEASSLEAFLHSRGGNGSEDMVDSPTSEIISFGGGSVGKQSPSFSPVDGAWESAATTASVASQMRNPKPKLNPFSSVFVPASVAMAHTASEPPVAPVPVPSAGVYRAPRSGSPPSGSPLARLGSAARHGSAGAQLVNAVASRQPKGPPSHAEDLEAQNFNSRLRKRAIGAIRSMNLAPRSPTSPSSSHFTSASSGSTFEYQQQQAHLSPGLAALMQVTRAKEERGSPWRGGDVSF